MDFFYFYPNFQSLKRSLDKGEYSKKEQKTNPADYDNNGCVECGRILFGILLRNILYQGTYPKTLE